MFTKQESVSGANFKAWPFSSVFNFGCKDGRVTTATCKYGLLVVSPTDDALCKFLPLPVVAKSSILNVAEFLDLPLGTSPYTKTSPVSCENQSFFLLFWNVVTFIESHCIFLCFFLQYYEVGCYHYFVFMDSVNDFSKSKLFVKEQLSLKSKIRFGNVCLCMYYVCNFSCPSFLLWSIFSPPVDVQLKRLDPLCWVCPPLS